MQYGLFNKVRIDHNVFVCEYVLLYV